MHIVTNYKTVDTHGVGLCDNNSPLLLDVTVHRLQNGKVALKSQHPIFHICRTILGLQFVRCQVQVSSENNTVLMDKLMLPRLSPAEQACLGLVNRLLWVDIQ
ncbi:hypothetical protein Ancab_021223 [Ancistrocladus abbreviatus]